MREVTLQIKLKMFPAVSLSTANEINGGESELSYLTSILWHWSEEVLSVDNSSHLFVHLKQVEDHVMRRYN